MTVYLDASVVVSLFVGDAHTERAKRLVSNQALLSLSDLTAAEFSSALAIHYRTGLATDVDVRAAFTLFDTWCELIPNRVEVLSSDIRGAQALIRQLDHPLKTPDAIHIMIARRLNASLATFDNALAREAGRLGLPLEHDGF